MTGKGVGEWLLVLVYVSAAEFCFLGLIAFFAKKYGWLNEIQIRFIALAVLALAFLLGVLFNYWWWRVLFLS